MRVVTRGAVAVAVAIAGALLAPVSVAAAEPAGYSKQDESYFHLLTVANENFSGFTISDPGLIRAQGLRACEVIGNGLDAQGAIHQLQAIGPYPFDAANRIVAAATVAYCPEYGGYY